jgi:hypothetical protein
VCPRRAPTAGCVQLGFEFREILLIFLAAAAVALAIWYLKTDVIGWRKSWTFC